MLFLRILIVAFIVTGIMDLLAKKSRKKTGALKKFVVRAPLDFAGLGTIVMIIGIMSGSGASGRGAAGALKTAGVSSGTCGSSGSGGCCISV